MDAFFTRIATDLGIPEDKKRNEIASWKKEFGKYCNSLEDIKSLVNDKISWARIGNNLDPLVEKKIRDKIQQTGANEDFFSDSVPPQNRAVRFFFSMMMVRSFIEVTKLNIPDILVTNGPQTIETLAEKTNTRPELLFRVMSLLSSFNVFNLSADKKFSANSFTEVLTENHPNTQKYFVCTGYMWWDKMTVLLKTLQTGQSACHILYKKSLFEYLSDNPTEKAVFGKGMENMSRPEIHGIIQTYDFSQFKKIVDIGASTGHVLKAILKEPKNASVSGVVFDLPSVIEYAESVAAQEGYAWGKRLQFVGGDFTKAIPEGDCMIIKYCIHNIPSEEVILTVLKECHKSMVANGKLLIIEILLPEIGEHGGRADKLMDVLMLGIFCGAKERSTSEYKALGEKTGWKLNRTVPIASSTFSLHIIEFLKN